MSDLKRVRVVKREEKEWEFQFPLEDKTILFVTVSTSLAANALRDMVDDAERYRHLCETSPYALCFNDQTFRSKQDLDAAIDAAMKREGER